VRCLIANRKTIAFLLLAAFLAPLACAQGKRKVIIDQDCAGPGGTDMQAILALINSPDTDVLGITVLTGDAWRDEEIQHTLRLLEIIGRTDIPVLPGAAFPLVNSKEYIAKWETLYGKVVYQGAWNFAKGHAVHGPHDIPPLPEGAPTTKALTEDAAHFMVRAVHQFPHEVTIYAAGPMTDLALAIALDPHFAELTKELIVMGGSINPTTDDPEFNLTPRREFNFWMDPEASHAVLHARWPRIVLTTVDISVKTRMEKNAHRAGRQEPYSRCAVRREIRRSQLPVGRTRRRCLARSQLHHQMAETLYRCGGRSRRFLRRHAGVGARPATRYGRSIGGSPKRSRSRKILQGVRGFAHQANAARASRTTEIVGAGLAPPGVL